MNHVAIEQVLARAERAKSDSDHAYFFALLYAAEALAKTIVIGIVASIADDKDRNRYRLEHQLVRADGLGDWGRMIEDALTGPASQYLLNEASEERRELTQACKAGTWQYDAVSAFKNALDHLGIQAEDVPIKSDMKRWFRLFATLRNKTRGHGATQTERVTIAAQHIRQSIDLVYQNFSLFRRPWAHLYRNLNGKYRVSGITEDTTEFDFLKRTQDQIYPNGVYLYMGAPRPIVLMKTDSELRDFYFANGGLKARKYEMLSYVTDDKKDGDGAKFLTPPGVLPPSETQGHGELLPQGNCFSNVPDLVSDYVSRPKLEDELSRLLLDDKRPIVTLVGRGGIGKTSLAMEVIKRLYDESRYEAIVWLSSRDVDLHLTGPKPVRPLVFSPEDMSEFYAELVLSQEEINVKGFNARSHFEQQLQQCDIGPCLFVFDNFETTQNPIEMFNWIDSFIRLPNKVLITTRLREFKGDYPVDVLGMEDGEARTLIRNTASSLLVKDLINEDYINKLVGHSEGHPYVIKILLGEVAKNRLAKNIPRLVAGSDDILTALFERTYVALSPCSQRAFLTLSAWNSPVPRLALEAVLFRSTEERREVEQGIESLLQYSMAELYEAPEDKQEFISIPLVAHVFGKKKLNISPSKVAIEADVEILQMLGPSRRDDVHVGLARRLEMFIRNVSKRIEAGASYDSYSAILEAICRSYNAGWLLLARWHMEERTQEGYELAKKELRHFLENGPPNEEAAEAWRLLGQACYQTGDQLGDVHACIERSQISIVSFYDLSNTANKLNALLRDHGLDIDMEQKRDLAARIISAMEARRDEADPNDFSRMAWLAFHSGREDLARSFVEAGLVLDGHNNHLVGLAQRLDLWG
ncbi:NB-ARC domain-containing protein [Thalassoglobus polymorphus]|uniref:NB-ARC domain protein n=1 Tax=Thalassoglobus polymorphus TaxID=2527994 RepID=A0A517QK97_9PLAN|nr:NB-ARC domain-containing protein [Thalassoglobus polymorphus]QDT32058.1 NB-ARC domain protein [Thalassoglobus polymorphus]